MTRSEVEAYAVENWPGCAGIAEVDVVEGHAIAKGAGGDEGVWGDGKGGTGFEEIEEVADVEGLLRHAADVLEDLAEEASAIGKGAGEENEIADADGAGDGLLEDVDEAGVVGGAGEETPEVIDGGAADRQATVFFVEALEEGIRLVDQVIREAEEFDLFGGGVTGTEQAEVVDLPALGSPAVEERISQSGEVGL